MYFELVGRIYDIETIAIGNSIHEVARLRRIYGIGRWRKRKGTATVRLSDGTLCAAEIHWYEAHGIGRKELKLKYVFRELQNTVFPLNGPNLSQPLPPGQKFATKKASHREKLNYC